MAPNTENDSATRIPHLESERRRPAASNQLHFKGDRVPLPPLFGRQKIQTLEADDASAAIFHEDHVVPRLLAEMFLFGVIKPNV